LGVRGPSAPRSVLLAHHLAASPQGGAPEKKLRERHSPFTLPFSDSFKSRYTHNRRRNTARLAIVMLDA
jgi:hypothetical protein